MQKIDFFLVGPPKCGTTTIYHWLKTNPAIFIPSVKEPHYFLFNNGPLTYSGPGDQERLKRMVITDESTYFGLYSSKKEHQSCGDCSTMYFYSEDAIRKIGQHNPEARIIIVLRNPIERAFSHFMHQVRDGYEKENDPLASFLRSKERIGSGHMPFWDYESPGNYSEWLPKWNNAFKHVLVLDYRQVMADPTKTMTKIADFLGVPDDFQVTPDQVFNQSGIPKFPWLNRLLKRRTLVHRIVAAVMPEERRMFIKNRILNSNNRKASLKDHPAFIEYLNKVYVKDLQLYRNLPDNQNGSI